MNSPEGTIFLYSLDISKISKTAEKIFEVLDEVVEKVGEENVVQVVNDHTTNYELAGKMLMEKRKRLFWTPSTAHCLELILEDFQNKLRDHQVTIAQCKKITTYIYSRTSLLNLFKAFH